MSWQDRGPERGAAALAGPMTIADVASGAQLSTGEHASELASPKRSGPNRTARYAPFAVIFLAALALGTYAGLRVDRLANCREQRGRLRGGRIHARH